MRNSKQYQNLNVQNLKRICLDHLNLENSNLFRASIFEIRASSLALGERESSIHRLGLGLQGSLIPFAPLAFVPQRQDGSSTLPSPLVFLMISTHFTTPPSIPGTPLHFKFGHIVPVPEVEPQYFKHDVPNRLRNSLRPVNPDNACTLRITATAGT